MKLSHRLMMFTLAMGAAFGTQVASIDTAQAATPDPTVKAALEQAGLVYKILDDGRFKVVMNYPDGRKQSVYINSGIDAVSTSSLRMIYAFPENARLDDRTMDSAFNRSEKKVIGGWEVNPGGALLFNAKVNSRLGSADLKQIIEAVAAHADVFEQEMGLADEK